MPAPRIPVTKLMLTIILVFFGFLSLTVRTLFVRPSKVPSVSITRFLCSVHMTRWLPSIQQYHSLFVVFRFSSLFRSAWNPASSSETCRRGAAQLASFRLSDYNPNKSHLRRSDARQVCDSFERSPTDQSTEQTKRRLASPHQLTSLHVKRR
jgi:hypothetical protein